VTRRANGEGSVSERKDGRWEGAAYVLLADGTYARRRVYGRTRQEASRRLTEIVPRSQAGLPADATDWTVERASCCSVRRIESSPDQTMGSVCATKHWLNAMPVDVIIPPS
jgi:integrase